MNRVSVINNNHGFRKQQGMTLLEVLVATGILAIISSMAFLSLDNLVQSKQALDETNSKLNQFNLAQFQLQSDIQMAISSNQINANLATPEFIGNSQSITLIRYQTALVPNQRAERSNTQSAKTNLNSQHLIRVKWYLLNNKLVRATQSAAIPLNSINNNQWQVRDMFDLNLMNCSYQNSAGQLNSVWPNTNAQNTQLPEMVNCQIQASTGEESILKLVPWQRAGWL